MYKGTFNYYIDMYIKTFVNIPNTYRHVVLKFDRYSFSSWAKSWEDWLPVLLKL